MSLFSATLHQSVFLFLLIAIGFLLAKFRFVPENAAAVLSKLENMLFIPALVMGTFMENFTVERIRATWQLLLISLGVCLILIFISAFVVKGITKDGYLRNVYAYGLAFSNFAFMGNAVVSALFPDIFFEYLLFTLPFWSLIYLWGVPGWLLADTGAKQSVKDRLKAFVNPMFIGMLIGMVIGLTGLPLPDFLRSVITSSANCMSPVAMLLTGMTIATIPLKQTFADKEIYIFSALKLIILPLAFVGIAKFVPIPTVVYVCTLCVLAMPSGLNAIVIPGAYGKDTSAAAGMAVISHLLSVITIPLIFLFIK